MTFLDGGPGWRAMTAADLSAVCALAVEIHPSLPERPEVFAEKLRLFPEGCLVLQGEAGPLGYAFAHPWSLRAAPPLDDFLRAIPADAECLYLHDAAVLPAARGKNAASLLIELLRAEAARKQLHWLALVAVYGASRLWGRFGFVGLEDPALEAKLASYGETAR